MAAKTAMQMPNLQMPTGYEEEQRKIALRRKLAQMMFEQGMGGDRARTPWDALAKIAQTGAGVLHEKRATKREGELGERIKTDFNNKRSQLLADIQAGTPPQALIQKYGADPMMASELEPYRDAFATSLKEREKIDRFGNTMGRAGDFIGKPIPGKPTDKVIDVNGQWQVNPVAMTADLFSNPLPAGAEVSGGTQAMPNPYGSPQQPPPAPGAAAAMPPVGQSPSAGGMDLSRLSPEEKQILQQELARRAGLPPQAQNMPMGSPLTPPPSQVIEGKPYWSVGGKWYDNPEGR